MKKFLVMAALATTVIVAGGGSALASEGPFGPFKFGIEGNFGTGSGDQYAGDSTFGLGARGEFNMQDMVGLPISIAASFDYYFVDCPSGVDCTVFETNLNGLYALPLPVPEMFEVYAGGGLNLVYAKVEYLGYSASDTDFGLNLLAGVKFDFGMIFTPFLETKFEAGGGDQFVISAGVLF